MAVSDKWIALKHDRQTDRHFSVYWVELFARAELRVELIKLNHCQAAPFHFGTHFTHLAQCASAVPACAITQSCRIIRRRRWLHIKVIPSGTLTNSAQLAQNEPTEPKWARMNRNQPNQTLCLLNQLISQPSNGLLNIYISASFGPNSTKASPSAVGSLQHTLWHTASI